MSSLQSDLVKMSKIRIRPGNTNDLEQVKQQIYTLARLHDNMTQYCVLNTQFMADAFNNGAFRLIVAETESSKIIGFLAFNSSCSRSGEQGLYVMDVFVEPTYRSHGLGLSFMVVLSKIARSSGARYLKLEFQDTNKKAGLWYKNMGFRNLTKDENLRFYELWEKESMRELTAMKDDIPKEFSLTSSGRKLINGLPSRDWRLCSKDGRTEVAFRSFNNFCLWEGYVLQLHIDVLKEGPGLTSDLLEVVLSKIVQSSSRTPRKFWVDFEGDKIPESFRLEMLKLDFEDGTDEEKWQLSFLDAEGIEKLSSQEVLSVQLVGFDFM